MRIRWLSSLLLVLGCFSATTAYGLWAVQHTVLDPDATEEVVRAVLRSRPVQDSLGDDLAAVIGEALPPGAAGEDELLAVAEDALSDPRFTAALASSVAAAHRAALDGEGAGEDDIVSVAGRGLDRAVRDALEAADPELARQLPPAADLSLDFEMRRMPRLGELEDRVSLYLSVTALLAVALLALAVGLHPDRPVALRKAGRFLAVTGGLWLGLLVLGPLALGQAGERARTLAPVIGVFTGRLLPPAVVFTVLGSALWLSGRYWRRERGGARAAALAAPRPRATGIVEV